MPLISKRRCTGAEWFSRSSTGLRFSLRCPLSAANDDGTAYQPRVRITSEARWKTLRDSTGFLVGAAGFEPTTCSTQNCRATRLRYTPIIWETTSIHASWATSKEAGGPSPAVEERMSDAV